MKTQYPMIPFPLIVKATDGDTEAINQILHHYRGYITKRSLRLMKDEYGNQSMVVDEVLRGRMETRLIFIATHRPVKSRNILVPLKRTSIPKSSIAHSPFQPRSKQRNRQQNQHIKYH